VEKIIGGSPFADSSYAPQYPASNAFDGSGSTFWSTAKLGPAANNVAFIGLKNLDRQYKVSFIRFLGRGEGNTETPAKVQLKYSDDGVTFRNGPTMDLPSISGWVELDVPDHVGGGTSITLWCVQARSGSLTIGFTAFEIEFFEEKCPSLVKRPFPTAVLMSTLPASLTRGFR